MKRLTYPLLITAILLTINFVTFANVKQQSLLKGNEIEEFYRHLAKSISYPQKAQQANVHGNSVILFDVVEGKLKDLKIQTELGNGCDIEVLNNILSFTNFKGLKEGKYALKTTFQLDGSYSAVINDNVQALPGYTELKITITAISPKIINGTGKVITKTASQTLNASSAVKSNKVKIETTEPLIILDGEPITAGLNSVDPETIESLTVLKDFSAITKYGEEGRNGALIITTKKTTDQIEPNSKIEIDKTNNGIKNNKEPINMGEVLIVLDNQITNKDLNSISPETIQSITVLKGFSATSLYGDGGKNAVLVITTKKATDKKELTQKTKQ